jgi:DNA-binding NarL/FixJ family response regulator
LILLAQTGYSLCLKRNTMPAFHIIIVDDHPLFRDAMKTSLASLSAELTIAEAGTLDEVTQQLTKQPDCDLVLLDLKMPGVHGLAGLAFLRAQFPSVAVAIVSGQEEPAIIRRALALGVSGFIPKSTQADTMRGAVSAILAGEIWAPAVSLDATPEDRELDDLSKRLTTLTPQQVRVLMMLRTGLLNKQIAYELDVSEATVKAHVSAILLKLNVDSRTQAVIAANKLDSEAVGISI